MSTAVGVHIYLPGASGDAVPPVIVQLLQRVGQGPPYSVGELSFPCVQAIRVLQVSLGGQSRVELGKQLVAEIQQAGYEARLLVNHASNSAWWPEPPSWPTWEWPPDQVAAWVQTHSTER